jgi:hypothetical protein
MAIRRQAAVPRWAIATLGGVTVATALIALFTLALGFDLGVAAVLGGGLGLVIVLFVARQFAAATVVMGVLEVAASALVAVLSIIAAIVGAFS